MRRTRGIGQAFSGIEEARIGTRGIEQALSGIEQALTGIEQALTVIEQALTGIEGALMGTRGIVPTLRGTREDLLRGVVRLGEAPAVAASDERRVLPGKQNKENINTRRNTENNRILDFIVLAFLSTDAVFLYFY